jgi:hypothetical protein
MNQILAFRESWVHQSRLLRRCLENVPNWHMSVHSLFTLRRELPMKKALK